MAFVVPFDGSELAETALVRASEFSGVMDERVVAVTVIPKGDTEYAREHGWIDADEPFDVESVVTALHERVTELVPVANFRHETVGRYASAGTISKHLRKMANEEDASMVFIGSENAGDIVSGISSVGAAVAAEETYDVVIIRNRTQPKVDALRDVREHRQRKSDFYR
ncbi:universal stress protein [Halolamina salina]|uniref:Universal stress protein n=1 Tax=Halolamina salina TaxID=1220023 RepID=A0ABD6B2Q5_9EURY